MPPGVARARTSGTGASETVAALRRVREHVEKTGDNVGDEFASEARKIHREEAEPRCIYGQATAEEADSLSEEGVAFHPLPVLPEDHN